MLVFKIETLGTPAVISATIGSSFPPVFSNTSSESETNPARSVPNDSPIVVASTASLSNCELNDALANSFVSLLFKKLPRPLFNTALATLGLY